MDGRMSTRPSLYLLSLLAALVLAPFSWCLVRGDFSLSTPDRRGYRLFSQEKYVKAATQFADPRWRGVALFRQGEFEEAEGVFAGFDTADASLNHGNALLMQGKYEEAAERYARALILRPEWEDAIINRRIALARAAVLKKEGGEMTGGELAADEIVFSESDSPPSAGEEQIEGGPPVSDAELRAVWLRQVQTRPADFLRAKFAHQHAMRKTGGD